MKLIEDFTLDENELLNYQEAIEMRENYSDLK